MNKVIKLLAVLLLCISCQHQSTESNEYYIESDPCPEGPIAYDPVSFVACPKQLFPEFDSLILSYTFGIETNDWSDSHHDSLFLRRYHSQCNDTNYWDECWLYGWSKDSNDWIFICKIFFCEMSPIDHYHHDELIQLMDLVADSIFRKPFYFSDEDWFENRDIYQNGDNFSIIYGKVRMR